ncbi:MAG: ribosome small subunit-dependent GTPase A [Ignavibacteriae bacterium]|nr:MAG: ribosome small subunit-dependent GTPase A [Ignavibacteriota bacterium]
MFLLFIWEKNIKGRIKKIESKDYYVLCDNMQIVRCSLRGKFKKKLRVKKNKLFTLDYAVIGDYVEFEYISENVGVINEIYKRKNYLSRKAIKARGSLKRGERLEQIIAANLDNIFIVSSIENPLFNNRFLDRAVVAAESNNISVNIIINKKDLDTQNNIARWEQLYRKIGYNVFVISAKDKDGTEYLKQNLYSKTNIFWGRSGVGKSTLLNSMFSSLQFDVGEISEYSQKGTHTTVTAVMKEVAKDTFIIDTPGVREIDPFGIEKKDLSHYFLEFLPFIPNCKFNTCLHNDEPECAVIKAVNDKKISNERYKSYLNILETIEDDMFY